MRHNIRKIGIMLFAAMMFAACEYDDTALNDRIDALEERVARLEEICDQINSDMAAVQALVDAVEDQVYVTEVEPLVEDRIVVGTVIRLSNGETIEIRNGKDGVDGQDGADGAEGYVPQIGVKEGSDGQLYWTLDGKWLLDENGDKVPVAGKNGQNGADGQDGQDGADGQDGKPGKPGNDGPDGADGKDGECPLLKIENGMWYVSTEGPDGPWVEVGRAEGPAGADGADGDTMFSEVIDGEYEVTIVLKDGQRFVLPKAEGDPILGITSIIPQRVSLQANEEKPFTLYRHPGLDNGVGKAVYAVSPKTAVKAIAEDWKNLLDFQVYEVQETRAVKFTSLDIIDFQADEQEGLITLTVTGDALSPEILENNESLMRCVLEVGNGNGEAVSGVSPFLIESHFIYAKYLTTHSVPLTLPKSSKAVLFNSTFEDLHDGTFRGELYFSHPDNVLEKEIFSGNQDILELVMIAPKTVEEGAFSNCPSLVFAELDFIFYDLTIGAEAFAGCSSLEEIYLISGFTQEFDYFTVLKSIGARAFSDCPSLNLLFVDGIMPDAGADLFLRSQVPSILVYPYQESQYMKHPEWGRYADHIRSADGF